MAERGLSLDHSTVNRWVIRYAPELENNFTKKYEPIKEAKSTSDLHE